MPNEEITNEQFEKCSSAIVNLILGGLKTDRGVHLETAIWAVGSLAGLAMLRDTGIDLSTLPAGQPVFSDGVNDRGSELIGYLANYCKTLGIDPNTGWTDEVAPDHASHISTVDLNLKFEPTALLAYEACLIPSPWRATAAGFAGVRLIQMGTQALNPEIGKAVLINAIQTGAKTVPARPTD